MSGSIQWDDAPKGGVVWDDEVQNPSRFQRNPKADPRRPATDILEEAASLLSGVRRGVTGNLGNYLDAPFFGAAHYLRGREPTIGAGMSRALEESKAVDASLADQSPIANIAGRLAGAVGTGVAAAPSLAFHAAKGVLPTLGAIGSYLGRNALFGAATGATEGDTMAERGQNALVGGGVGAGVAAALPAAAKAAQAIPNIVQGGRVAYQNLTTKAGQDAIAGQVMREFAGNGPIAVAPSPLPGLTLRTTQATGNPGLASLEQSLESAIRQSGTPLQGGRTPAQMSALSDALLPGSAGREPADLLRAAGERGTRAVQSADAAISATENKLWGAINRPINAAPLADHLASTFAQLPEAARATATKAQAYINRVRGLGENASLTGKESINGVRSDLLRSARSETDSDARYAYSQLARAMVDYVDRAPEIAGRPMADMWFMGTPRGAHPIGPSVNGAAPRMPSGGEYAPSGLLRRIEYSPEVPADPASLSQWRSARDYTRGSNEATGYPEIQRLISSNSQGNITANPATAFGAFLPSGGGAVGVHRLEEMGKFGGGAEIGDATREFIRARALRAGRTGTQDAAGNPHLNPGAIARHLNTELPGLRQTPTVAGPEASQLGKVAQAAELLARPQATGRVSGSNTFDKFRSGQLMEMALGQAAGPLVGGVVGAGAADYMLPGPSWATMPAGFAAGMMAGRAGVSPLLNNRWINAIAGQSAKDGVEAALIRGLESPNEATRLMALRMLQARGMFEPGRTQGVVDALGRSAIPATAHGVQ